MCELAGGWGLVAGAVAKSWDQGEYEGLRRRQVNQFHPSEPQFPPSEPQFP